MFVDRLVLKNLLSFKDSTVELGQLNVLIGPNAVGKSNLIEAISLLQAAATSLPKEILRGGGVRQWLWLGEKVASPIASLECRVNLITGRQTGPLAYSLSFSEEANGFVIVDESLTGKPPGGDPEKSDVYFHRAFNQAEFGNKALELMRSPARPMPVTPSDSVLSQFKNPLDPHQSPISA